MEPADVLRFWFVELEPRQWFAGGEALDADMRARFEGDVSAAAAGEFDAWEGTPRGRLALIILLDQFSRNIFRGGPQAFASDVKAQDLSMRGIELGMDRRLTLDERQFFYLPLTHAEDPALQAMSVKKFTELADEAASNRRYATAHAAVIERFGRFPARNECLGRPSTSEEQAFLASGEGRF